MLSSTPLRLSIGACSLSSTTKLPWANEDAQFVAGNYCGVFDGVSALPASRAYARQLSGLTRSTLSREGAVIDAAAWKRTVVNALQAAARGAERLDGASTACLACVDLERRQLSTYVLGDSGWLLFAPLGFAPQTAASRSGRRSGRRLCARSSPQRHSVGAPYQLVGGRRADRSDPPSAGLASTQPLLPGSVLLLHTDGLLDNLALDEIAELVERDAARGASALARRLAAAARARRLKPDDVTVVAVLLDERGSSVDASSVAAWSAVGLLGLAAASALQLGAL